MKRAAVLHFHQLRTGHVLLALLLLWSTPTLATTVDWRTEAADGNWDGGTGCGEVGSGTSYWWYGAWTPNQARGRPDCFGNHQIVFGNNDDTTMTLNGGSWYNANTITFASAASSARTIGGGNGLDMRDSGAAIDNDSSATHVFNVQVAFNVNPVQFRVDSGDLTFSTNIYFKSNWMDVYGGAGKTLNLNGVLKRDGGDGGIAVKEDVIVNITNNNDASASDGISGAYWIERGVIRLAGSTNAPGASGIINIGTNASLQLNANQVWRPSRINIYGVGTNGVGGLRKYTSSGSMTWPGIVNFANTSAIGVDGGELILSGIVTGASQVTMVGSGTLILTNVNNAFTGMMIVSNGTVLAAVTGALGTVQTSTIGVDVKNGASLGLNALTYPNETLQITGLGVTNGGALIRAGTGATYPGQINVVAGSAGGARIQGGLTVSGIINLSNNTLYVRAPNTFTMASGSTISNATKNTGDGAIYKDGSSIFSLRPSSDLTGTVTIADGTLELAPNASGSGLVAGNFLILSNGVTVRSDGTAARTVNKITRIDGDVTLNGTGGNGGAVTYAGNVNLTGGTRILTATNATISGVISNGALSKAGAGILTLSGSSANVYTGLTTVTAGQLDLGKTAGVNAIPANISLGDSSGEDVVKLQANNQIADTSVLTLNGTAVNNRGVLRLNGYAETIGGLSGNGVVEHNIDDTGVGSSASTLTIDLSGSQTHDGVVRNTGASSTGTLAINKDGVGTQTFTGSNTYSGATAIRAGTLINLGSNTASAIGVGTSGFYYSIGHAGTLTVTGQISAGTASNTIGTLRAVAVNMQNSGRMQVNYLNSGNMNGAAGTDWDVITVDGGSGTYTVNAVDGSDFVIALKGTPTFNPALGYTNIIVDAGTASSFVANKFTVDVSEFNGGSLGGGTVTVDADSGNLRLIFAPGTAPDVVVLGNATAIPDGDTTPAYGDDTDYSDVLVAGGTLTKTFTITNSGTATLGIGNVYTNAGGNPTNFVVTAQPASSLAAGLTTTFQVLFNPSTSGVAFADFEFTNNVSSAKNPYTFRVQGTGTYVEVAVSGLGNNIADGDAIPSGTDGTDFGSIALTGGTQLRTFVITNSGNRTLTISGGITTSGTHAVDFQITTPPSATIAPSGSTSFVVTFNPSAVGTRSATINFSNNDDSYSDSLTESSFDFAVQGFGVAPSITTFPTSLSFSSVLGTAPAAQVFSITNNGLGSMTWTLSTNVTWLSVSNVTGSAAAGAGQVHTAYVGVLAGQVAGTSNATITVTSPEATNSTQTITVQWTISAIPDPSAQSATASGAEHVALRWTKNASYNVMIVHRAGAASTAPSQGTTYNVGGSLGGGTVIYKGSGAYLDHIVSAGTTNYYAFYSYNGDYYSSGVTASDDTTVYQVGEIVEPFAYTNGAGISGLNGGQGWTSTWTYVGGTISVVTDRFTSISGYPSLAGNAITSASPEIYRGFAPVTAGKLYVAFMMRTDDGGNTKYNGLSFFDATEEKFFGEGFSQINQLTVGSASGRQLANNTDYTIIAMYDFDNDVAKALLYTNATESVPTTEPGTWHVEEADASVSSISRIRLAGNTGARWDEIRVATTWQDLLSLGATYEWDAGAGVSTRVWNNATNWTRNTEPTAVNNAYINGGYTAVIASAGAVATNLFVGTTNAPTMINSPTGTVEQTGGTLTLDGDLVLGDTLGSRGVYRMTNGTLTLAYEDIFVGVEGLGLMTITGTANVVMSGGTDDNLLVGFGSASGAETAGSTLFMGGSAVIGPAYDLRIAQEAGADGTLSMAGGLLQVTNNILVGIGAGTVGRITLSGGTLDTYSHMRIGDLAGSTGIVTLTGGLLNLQDANLLIGNDGLGVMSVSGTATVDVNDVGTPSAIEGNIVIGDDSQLTNTLMVSGSAVINVDDDLYLGDDVAGANGILQQSGGTISISDNAYIGDNLGSTGTVLVSSGNLLVGGAISVGNAGRGNLSLSGGAITVGVLRVSDLSTGTGTVTVTGGSLIVTNTGAASMVMEQSGGVFQQSAGTVEVVGGIQLGDVAGARATMLLNGGTLLVGRNNASTEDFQLGNTSGSTGLVQMTGGYLDLNRSGIDLRLGDASTSVGIFTQGGGTTTVGNVIYVGSASSSYGSLFITNGVLEAASDLLLASGSASTGFVLQVGGRVAAGGNIEITTSTGNESYYEIQGGTLTNAGSLTVGRADALGTGVFHVVGGNAIIHVGDGTTEDFRIQNSGELRLSFSNSTISAIQVSDDIVLSAGSTLSISNYGGIADGEYLVATSRNASLITTAFTTTNWLGGYTGTITYTGGCIRITFTTPSEIAVLGTNLAVITAGDLAPGTADGTDFGSVAVVGATLDRTFYITNSGGGNLTISGVTTSGADAARFSVQSWPGIVSPLAVSNLIVRFDPTAVGLATAVLSIANNDSDENPYTFGIQGFGVAPSITTFPTSLSFSSVLGTAPATQTFSITNNGLGSMTWTLSTNVTWLSVSNVTGSAAAGAGQVHTAYVGVLAGQVAGTSNATITVTSPEATNSTQTIAVQWTISAIPDPSAQSATADGAEMVRLAWTKDASYNVMIVQKATNAPSVPANGTTYSNGHAFADGSRVVAFNSGASTLEHIVAAGSTNYYAFYSMNGNYYSPGVSAGVTMAVYRASEIVDQAAYTNGVTMNGRNGGNGWAGTWGGGTWVVTNWQPVAAGIYPSSRANAFFYPTNGAATLTRSITAVSTGRIYASYVVSYGNNGAGTYGGLQFVSNSTALAFAGLRGGSTVMGVEQTGGAFPGNNSSYTLSTGTNNSHTILVRYDFSTRELSAIAVYRTGNIPATEPVSWDASYTLSAGHLDMVNAVRLDFGGFSGNSVGNTFVDEIRVAQSWAELLNLTQPVATAYAINGGVDVTDGQIVDGSYSTVFDFYDTAGITNTSTLPNYDIWNATGTRILTNQTFASKVAISGGATMRASNSTHVGASGSAVVLGVYTSRWTAANSNGVQISNSDSLSNGTKTVFTVVDDDTAAPTTMNIHSPEISVSRSMHITTNGVGRAPDGGTSPNIRYSLTDGYLASQISGGAPLIFYFGARDAGSGLSLGNGSATTNSSLTIGSAIVSNTLQWDATRNSAFTNTYAASATNVWSWTTPFLAAEVDNLVTNTADGYGTNKVTLTWRDNDFDRSGDQSSLTDQQHGYLIVVDDDLVAPVITNNFRAFGRALNGGTFTNDEFVGGFSVTGSVGDAFSGLYAGASNTLVVKYQDGSTVTSGIWSTTFANGGNGALSNTFVHAHLAAVGVYTMSVTVVDYDIDRPNDSLSTTSNFVFTVVNAPTIPGLGVGPLTLSYSAMLGSDPTAAATFSVTNVGQSGVLLYTNYQAYSVGASGWFAADPTNNSLAVGVSRIHTGWVGSASIINSIGTYYATNRVDGNQTNSAQLITITLSVTNIPAPTSVSATRDGAEMVRLAAAEAAGRTVLVVYAQSNAPSASPANGTGYNVGSTLGNGTVIFKFQGSASLSNLEHVVAAASTNFYAFYTVNNDRYSTGVVIGATNTGYLAYEIVDPFSYTNGVGLQTRAGGQGWTNGWALSVPVTNADAVVDSGSFATFQNYWPSEAGNRFVFKTSNSTTHAAFRGIAPVTSGKIYVAALYRRQYNENATDAKFSGLRFMGATINDVVAFVGERGTSGNDDIFGVSTSVGGGGGNTYGATDSFPAGIEYLLIGRYDFDTDIMAGIYYTSAQSVPDAEPAFFVETTNSSITEIRGISMVAGATSGWNGEVYFDELRVATNWSDLLLRERLTPYATNFLVNGGSDVTDAQVTSGVYGVRVHISSQAGVESTNTMGQFFQPNYDIFNAVGSQILTDQVFSTFTYQNSGQTLLASNTSHAGAVPASVVLGVYTMRWSAVSSNGNAAINVTTLSNGTAQAFNVVDDDTLAPTIDGITSTNNGSSRNLHISLANAALSGGSGSTTNITYTTTDQTLATVAATNPLIFWMGAGDASLLSRGTTGSDTNSHFSLGSAIQTNVAGFSLARSTPDVETTNTRSTNAWAFTTLSAAQIENLVTNTALGLGTNAIVMTWRDADQDRANDATSLSNQQHGLLVVTDDDDTGPTIQNFNIYGSQGSYTVLVEELTLATGWFITGRVSDASGVNVNGSETNQPNNSPYFELWDSSGTLKLRQAFNGIPFSDGGATSLSSLSNGISAALSGVSVGTWTARVIVADNDEDFGNNDHHINTNEIPFTVKSGSALGGLARGPSSFVVTSYYGVVSGVAPWPNFAVTNIGSGTLNYSNTITYGSAAGWLSVAPASATLVGNGASQIHTAAVNAASLNPGTYTATITINGDQTNSAQTISVTLAVFGFYAGEIVDQFTNTVAASLNGLTGGTGWTNAWSSSPSGGFSIDSGNHTVPVNYPSAAGNKVCGNSATEIQSYRYFPAFSTGKVFMAATIQKDANNNNGFAGLSFYNGSTEVGFVGKLYGQEWFGIDNTNGTTASTFGFYQSQYFIVGMYDFSNKVMYARAYNSGETLSLTQPSSWHAVNSNYVISRVDGIRIAGKEVGTVCFDEIRVASSWEGMLNLFTNEPTVHAAGMSFYNVTTGSMVVGWTPGNGANRIVVARQGTAVTFSPTDGVAYAFSGDYSAGTDLGGGQKIIYNGSGTNVSLTGLQSATQYFFRVYEYNGAGASANYYTNAGFLTGSRWTLGAEPTTGLAAFNAYQSSTTAISNTWLLGSTILLDLGRHDGGVNGDTTVSPDNNGNYWNNIGPTGQAVTNGTKIVNMVNVMNGATTVGLEVTSDGLQCNGILNGGLLNPSPALLGILAITNATEDYFFTTNTHTFKVTGLNTASTYSLTFFGSRDSTETRITTYTVGSTSVTLTTSGTGVGAGGVNYNNDTTAVLRALAPNSSGELSVTMAKSAGQFGYLNTLKIEEETSASGFLILRQAGSVPTNRPSDGVGYTNGQYVSTSVVATVVTPSYATTVLHTGLLSCTPYYFTIYPYRQSSGQAETYNYLLSGALTSTATTACGEPTIQASNIVFSLVATNFITFSWQNGNGEQRVVVVRGTNAVNADPVDNATYTANATYGSGSHLGNGNYVVYSGTGSSMTVNGLLSGQTYHFRVYEFNGSSGGQNYNTNTAVNNPRSSAAASFSLVEDKFIWNYFGSYANNNLNGAGTGAGWTNSWSTFGGYVAVDDANMPAFKGYPSDTRSGCGISCDDSRQLKISTVAGTAYGAYRNFPARSGGQLFGAIKFNVSSLPSGAFFGVSFLNGTTETGFVGKAWGVSDARLTIEHNGSQSVTPTFSTNTYTIGTGSGNDYLLVFEYDFDAKVLKARAYATNQLPHALPDLELGWAVEMTNVNISRIDGIRIAGQNVGDLYFDHIRLGPSWEQVVWDLPVNWHQDYGPVPTLVYIGTNYNAAFYSQVITNLSDAELRDAGKIDFAVRWESPTYGVFLTNAVATNRNIGSPDARVSPNWDPLAVSNLLSGGGISNQFNLDRYFTNYFGANGSLVVTTYQYNAFNITNINFDDQYFVTVSAETFHNGSPTVTAPNGTVWDNVPVQRALTVNKALRFYVYDDDTNQPLVGSSRPLRVMTNGVLASVQDASGLDRYRVYDGIITQLGLQVSANIYDAYSGLQRSSSGTESTNLNVTIEYFVTNNAAAWSSSLSSALTTNSTSTSVWSFAASAFTYGTVSALWGGDGTSSEGQDLDVLVNAPDADDDRTSDYLWRSNELVGFIRVVDDDTTVPFATNTAYGGVSGSRLFAVTTNSTPATVQDRAGIGLDVVYNLTDDELVNADSRNLRFAFGAIDVGSGLSRGTSGGSNNVMSFSVASTNGAILVANNMSHYDASQSSVAGAGVVATSVWSFTGSHIFTETLVNNMMTNGLAPNTYVNTNRMSLTAVDADNDRTNDAAVAYDLPVGQITVRDDDRLAPNVGGMAVMGSAGTVVPTDLYISEYVEGSSNNKYIEIFNGTGGPVNLADYAVGVYFNGAITFTGVNNPAYMSGSLANGATYIIANDNAVIWGGTPDQIEGSVGNFNGNDAILLIKKVGLVTNVIDVLGIVGDSNMWLTDVTAVRRGSVTGPSSTWITNDWAYLSQNVLGGLGGHSAADPVTDGDLAAGGFVVLTGTVQDVTSGIYAQTGDPRAPRRSIKSNAGVTLLADGEFSHKPSSNGDAKTAEPLWENALGAVDTNNITLGTYTATVSAVDYDIDRPSFGDNMTNSFPITFSVVDDDTTGPTAATNVISTHTGWTNSLSVTVRWSTNSVVDASGISLWRTSTNEPTAVTNGSLLGSGAITQGTFTLTIADEGIKTNLLWAVDADGDRSLDQMYGASTSYLTKLDITAPLGLSNVSNDTTDINVDETEELKVSWTPGVDEATVAGKRGDGTPLSPWGTYLVTYHELNDMGQELNTNQLTATNGPATLATWNTSSMIISNLDFDSTYRIRIAGRDEAGNVGPETVVTGETVRFVVTQGLARVESTYNTSNQVDVYWLASTNKVYDVLYTDSPSLQDNLTNSWKLLSTVTNNWMFDNGGVGPDGDVRIGPALNQNTIRFYRVSRKDVWRTNYAVRRASIEVYAAKAIKLVPGENWVSLFATPDTSTVAYVLGTNRLVGGTSIVDSPKISWFASTSGGTTNQSGVATSIIYFASSGNWLYWTGGVGSANQKLMPQNQAFLLELPPGSATQRMVVIGLVPTQEVVQTIGGGTVASNNIHVLSYTFPQRTKMKNAGFFGSGLVGHTTQGQLADEIRVLKNRNGIGSLEAPRGRFRLDTAGTNFIFYSGSPSTNVLDYADGVLPGSANNFYIEPDDAVIVVRRNAGTMYWTNRPSYTPPGKNINP